ncbi:uncharacterized protein LOC112508989 [Cynara cardunculus var. scolymus]|uniref:Uncharacterized protein n=1 Tax=Cynara cardunculus var. scolymus TaxID=59895 RepID=A0A103YHU7_CYNCS|nr:uncharacterized protein LOC112508989 [Cynara cardunculus var. scolymus]KVI09396.1 hypothetical protein Ccrd_012225 [Cynara cardunculus var. scolymus]
MENPTILSTNINGRASSASNSPEFEFWMIRNPSSQQTTLHSADELFSGGVLLPLQHLNTQNSDDPPDKDITTESISTSNPDPDSINGSDLRTKDSVSASKRWKDIFKKSPESKEKDKKKKKERNGGGSSGGGGATSSAELNINLWPFSRSRSAGNGGSRPRTVVGNRKVSSAPCSRSNSTGESKYRKWPSSPNRGGVHLGRSSPVWQVKRFGQSKSLHDHLVRTTAEKSSRPAKNSTTGTGAGVNAKVLNLNVPTCIGYRQRMSCRSDVTKENNAGRNADVTPTSAGAEGGASSLFNLRSLFTKKVF